MACKRAKVFLGFDDEVITDKYKSQVNFTTNKLGGNPNWPLDGITSPLCKLCGLPPPIIVQIYAPLENSPYHRTLYLFGCLNPNCWNQNESWVCFRSQVLDSSSKEQTTNTSSVTVALGASDWCADADDWDEDLENGNLVAPSDINDMSDGECEHSCNTCTNSGSPDSADDADDVLDIDGQSTDALSSQLGKMRMDSAAERDANFNASWNKGRLDGARANLHSPQASAEIEGDESELVTIDTPTGPQFDLHALLQESAPLPKDVRNAQFTPYFICVAEEDIKRDKEVSGHVRLLLAEYQQSQGQAFNSDVQEAEGGGCAGSDSEKYEQSIPAHGDVLFHRFLQHIQQTPGQILRYCREGGSPLPIAPLVDVPSTCSYCQGEMVFELQVLPSIIPKLRLQMQGGMDVSGSHIEFGTVLIWTCRQSCWATGDNVREERVIVQAERF
ncbi:programmed cell death protein 2-like isoform X2 [Thrips palmi]|uniref:Programmed cell death protein 2-like isoform X2 n=1 Tax=Thrips palmi TaxID=161013 RepID=A0A6P9AN59_THRPL|nr:programmed cell death protein 2-like isoform X2 [Thrips palmi]